MKMAPGGWWEVGEDTGSREVIRAWSWTEHGKKSCRVAFEDLAAALATAGTRANPEGGLCSVPIRVQLFVTPWTVARQAPLSMEFSRQEY